MRLPEALTEPNAENSFGGVRVAQSWNDLAIWEEFLSRHPISSIIELGTWSGAMASFLGVQGLGRGFDVVTIDNNPGHLGCAGLLDRLGVQCLTMDLLGPDAEAAIQELLVELPHPLMLFCDNGHKPAEYQRFVPLLQPGDLVAVHDWNKEIWAEDLIPRLPILMQQECEALASLTRFFRVTPA